MRAYQTVQAINSPKKERLSVLDIIDSFLSTFSKSISLSIVVPANVFLRTKLLCEYISEKAGIHYGLADFILAIYVDFIESSIEKYNPRSVHEAINRSHGYDETLLIHDRNRVYSYQKREGRDRTITFTMDKKLAEKGQLLLEEMEDLYGDNISLEKMIATLWTNFIEEYKMGNNQKGLQMIIKMLRDSHESE